jgi:cell division protein FtsI (penicillin-binding protein 3)
VVIAFLSISIKLFQIQILEGEKYAQKARKQQTRMVPLESRRGSILDRSGQELALDLPQLYTLGVHPSQVTRKKALCRELAGITGRPYSHYQRRLQSLSKFVYLEWRLTPAQAERLEGLNIGGLSLKRTSGRFYPHPRSTSQVLGYTDVDGRGIAGLEVYNEEVLTGEQGWETHQRDGRGVSFWDPLRGSALPRDGGTVRLTIDIVAQEVLHYELMEAQSAYRAEWAGGILINPKTGEILAMCSVPDFDPLRPETGLQSNHKLRPVTDLYEPGSVYKIVTATAALEKGAFSLEDSIDCENGAYQIGSRTLRDVHKLDRLSFADVMVYSSNIGMAKVAEQIGSKELYRYSIRYGFGTPTGIDFPGEASWKIRPFDDWRPIDQANIAMGQGISGTMLQVALAYAAIANDGILMEPRLIINQTDATGKHNSFPPREVRRIMEPQTARALQKMLTRVVDEGTGSNAAIPGLRIAGKTGTAQIPNLKRGGYYSDRFVATFVGFLPAEKADRLLIIAVCDPKGGHYGSQVAAPVFKRVIQRLMPADAIRKSWKTTPLDIVDLQGENNGLHLPNMSDALDWLFGNSLSDIAPDLIEVPEDIDQPLDVVPDLAGLSIREAICLLSKCGLKFKVDGAGWIVHQSIEAGTPLNEDMICQLEAKE